jgi:hypothetical protein
MRSVITIGVAALALSTAAVSAFAENVPSYSNTGPRSAPLSPGGISAAASAYGGPGPGYIGPEHGGAASNLTYSNTGPRSAPLSPGGISAAASAYGGPGAGYIGPEKAGPVSAVTYSNITASGAPLSPGGISAGASAYGGPGYMGH